MADPKDASTTRHYLNALKRAEGTLPAPKRGIWNDRQDFLARYAESVDIQGELTADRSAHSVPSVFQRPILFYQALKEEKNPLHRAMRAEWRGLMATLCLAKWLDLPLEPKLFRVPQVQANAASSVGTTPPGDLHFLTMLHNQRPLRTDKDGDGKPIHVSDWEEWWLIRCGGAVLGATSPWTLVYTSSQPKAPASIPWQRNGLLIDPVAHYDPKGLGESFELSILYGWVQALLAQKTSWKLPDHLSEQNNLVSSMLSHWSRDLERYRDPNVTIKLGSSHFPEALFSRIICPPERVDGAGSDLLLSSPKAGKPVLVLSSQPTPERRVLRGVFSSRIDVAGLAAEGESFFTREGVRIQHAYVVPEKLFFPPKLVHVKKMQKAFMVGASDLSVPLTPAFFKYFDEADLECVSLVRAPNGYNATIQIAVSGGEPVTITHHYEDKDIEEISRDHAPGFALWPDQDDSEWTENFAAYAAPGVVDLQVRPLHANGQVPKEAAWDDPNQRQVRIWSCTSLPVGFALESSAKGGEGTKRGLLLRQRLLSMKPLDHRLTWEIGVDFGTSSTMVMIDRGSGPEEMPFGGRLLLLAGESGQVEEITRNFYPADAQRPPFRTLLYKSTATQFDPKAPPYTLRFTSSTQDLIHTVENVKWGKQPKDSGPLLTYLQALVRYIMWEARVQGVKTVNFHWSYPRSLPPDAFRIMKDFWEGRVRNSYSRQEGINIGDVDGISESEAACRAFAHADALIAASGLSITIDVGGGSTDIAFWSANELVDQLSFKLAGNDILDRTILSEATLRQFFHVCYGSQMGASDRAGILARPEIYLNGALTEAKKDGLTFNDRDPNLHPIPMHIMAGNQGDVPWIHLRSMIYLFYTGLSYYLGVHSRTMKVDSRTVRVYFGGRASALLTWMGYRGRAFMPAMMKAFRTGLGRHADDNTPCFFTGTVDPSFSGLALDPGTKFPRLKTEVAQGLLVNRGVRDLKEKQEGSRAGEIGWTKRQGQKKERIDWNTWLNPADYEALVPPSDFESAMIGHYMAEMLTADNFKSLNLDADQLKKLEIDQGYVEQLISDAGENGHASQPLFAYELKALMHAYATAPDEALPVAVGAR